ncbi:hypothetical protein Nepgr_001333 [Nepenthes gracilis]|uniref:Clp R domain-containing protein n=1 Tax=Nepenthes gracilis TaxID=150966 RepID=A0AAD3RWX4_NEPGR|nr:hypothetical protein Nepgr_001333 [Nepenthes gracilis]
MRAGGCSNQQSLTPEAASIVKQAINLARRRGHAQVTPIHVASVMLASPAGLLKAACLKSHSHPLQCKALELCFNVALNRLPTITLSPILGPHSHYPSLSNALVAAFKRAQAHQRRGSIENQQQPILALKIETEQLVISILDDPSVSRVMRESGFSSTQVKANVEQSVSLEICSQDTPPLGSSHSKDGIFPFILHAGVSQSMHIGQSDLSYSKPFAQVRKEDIVGVIDSLVSKGKKKNTVIVGECLADCEGVVRGIKDKIERGDVPLDLKYAQFSSIPIISMKHMSREEVDLKLEELRCLLKSCVGRGVVLCLGDLKWVSEYWAHFSDYQRRRSCYCPVEHMIMGIRRLASANLENGRLWLLCIATFNSYIKCKAGHPSLETLLDLHPLSIPFGSLDLSLNLDSNLQGQKKGYVTGDDCSWPLLENRVDMDLTCCTDCSDNFHRQAQSFAGCMGNESRNTLSTSPSLPPWLQKCKAESREQSPVDQQECPQIRELCKKWNSFCRSTHKIPHSVEKTLKFSSSWSPSSTSISSYDQRNPYFQESKLSWPIIFEPKASSKKSPEVDEPNPDLLSNPNSTPNSASSSEGTEAMEKLATGLFREHNPENVKVMCSALEKKVPWQKDIIPDIVSIVLKCRSGMMRGCRKGKSKCRGEKQETWLFFLGLDDEGKLKIAKELAKLVFASRSRFELIGLSSFSSTTRADSTDDLRNKRARDESGHGYLERFAEAVRDNPHRVFYVEDVEQVDHCSQKGIKRAIESGRITLGNGDTVPLEDAIVVFSCESFSSTSRACSPPIKQKLEENLEEAGSKDDETEEGSLPCVPLDLNIAAEDGNGSREHSMADIGILESVDKQIFFKVHVL